MDRYSPFFTSKWMPDNACVSTSSVTKTLLTCSNRIKGSAPLSITFPFYENRQYLVQLYSVVIVVGRHIGKNHAVAYIQPALHFNGAHRAAPEGYLHRVGVLAIRLDFEEPDSLVLLPENGSPHIHHVIHLLQLDGAVHAQVRT